MPAPAPPRLPPTPVTGALTAAADGAARSAATAARVRVGCDVQGVDAVAHAVRHFGARYLDRVYTTTEQADCRAGGPTSLAGRFAAKEAVLKLLGSADGIDPRTVEVTGSGGRPRVQLHGSAARLARASGIPGITEAGAIDVSISHDAGVAFAVAVTRRPPDPLTQTEIQTDQLVHQPDQPTSPRGDHS